MLCRNRKLIFLSWWNQGSSAQHRSVCRSLFYIWFFKKSCDSSILHSFRNPWGEVSFRVAKNLTTMIFCLTNSKLPKLIALEWINWLPLENFPKKICCRYLNVLTFVATLFLFKFWKQVTTTTKGCSLFKEKWRKVSVIIRTKL